MASASSTASRCGEGLLSPASEQPCKSGPEAPNCCLESRHQGRLSLLHLSEVAIQLRETEGPVDLRAGEYKAITGELYAFNDTLSPFSFEDRLDAMPLQPVPQFVPVMTTGKLLPNRIIDFVPGSVGLTKPFPPDGLLARSQMQPEALGRLAAHLRIAELDVRSEMVCP